MKCPYCNSENIKVIKEVYVEEGSFNADIEQCEREDWAAMEEFQPEHRDLAMEAHENGHDHVVYLGE